jgi:uncharacterized protein (TIRG00374 family)
MNDESKPPNNIKKPPRLWGLHTILSGLATLFLLAVLATFVDWQSVWREISVCKKRYVLLGALCHYIAYPVRGLRWRYCLNHLPIRGNVSTFGRVVFFYNFVDNLVPGKLGDIYAAHLARINFGIRRSAAIGSIVFQRTLDAWIVLSVAVLASWALLSTQLPNSVLWTLIGGSAIASASTLVMLIVLFLDKSLHNWIPQKIVEIIRAFRKGMWPHSSEMPPIIGLTAIIWILETLWIYFLTHGFGLTFMTTEVLFVTMIPLLASAFPLTPSGEGIVELTMFSCLRFVSVSAPLAGSITLLNRFFDYWLHIVIGVLMWRFRRRMGLRTWREISEPRDASAVRRFNP